MGTMSAQYYSKEGNGGGRTHERRGEEDAENRIKEQGRRAFCAPLFSTFFSLSIEPVPLHRPLPPDAQYPRCRRVNGVGAFLVALYLLSTFVHSSYRNKIVTSILAPRNGLSLRNLLLACRL